MVATRVNSVSRYAARDQRTICKYLEKYAEPEAELLASEVENFSQENWDYVVTIPACGEDEFLPGALDSINGCQAVQNNNRVLCLIVLNGNEAREDEFSQSNERMRSWFSKHCTLIKHPINPENTCPLSLVGWKDIDILIVDRSQPPWLIPADQGVGLVRKIAADCALALIVSGNVNSRWIHATDADARVPGDYFLKIPECLAKEKNNVVAVSCFIYPYQHIPDPEMEQRERQRYWSALRDYELWLRYYVAGLQWTGSRYAYPSIGSLLAFDALAYARSRGFPKRMAGEDFYFQNKLAKLGQMKMLDGVPVELLTRASTRVPFGTGQGTISIDRMNNSGENYTVYHPQVFEFVKDFHSAVQVWFDKTGLTDEHREGEFLAVFDDSDNRHIECKLDYKTWLSELISELAIFKNLKDAEKRSKSVEGAHDQFDDWFDGFKTLKLIHRLRDDLYGSLPLLEALECAAFLQVPELTTDDEYLKKAWLNGFRSNSTS